MLSRNIIKSSLVLSLLFTLFLNFSLANVNAANSEQVKTVTVTLKSNNKTSLPSLGREDFLVSEDGAKQEVISVVPATATNAPINLAIVVQDGISQVNTELGAIKQFVKNLPTGSQVMITYLNGSFTQVLQPFTTDLESATQKIRVVNSFSNGPASPYLNLIDVMKQFNGKAHGRNQILLISNGVDSLLNDFSPRNNLYLNQAIKAAQQENISIYSIFANGTNSRRVFLGQNNLNYLSEETGGYAFIMGTGFVTFDAPLKQFREMLDNQYVVTYKSTNDEEGFRRVKITTDFSNIKVTTLSGYTAKK